MPPATPGRIGAGTPELDREAERAERQQQVGDLRMRDRAQHPLRPRHLDGRSSSRPLCAASRGAPSKRVIVRPSSLRTRSGHVVRDEIDERRRGAERFLLGERAAVGDRLLDERDVAPALRRERPRVGGDVGRHLLRHHLVDLFAVAGDRVRGADVRAGRHGGDVGGDGDEEAGRRGAVPRRPDEHGDRRLRADDGVVDVARGVDQAAGRAQREDDQRGAAASAFAIAARMYSAATGWMMPSTSAV